MICKLSNKNHHGDSKQKSTFASCWVVLWKMSHGKVRPLGNGNMCKSAPTGLMSLHNYRIVCISVDMPHSRSWWNLRVVICHSSWFFDYSKHFTLQATFTQRHAGGARPEGTNHQPFRLASGGREHISLWMVYVITKANILGENAYLFCGGRTWFLSQLIKIDFSPGVSSLVSLCSAFSWLGIGFLESHREWSCYFILFDRNVHFFQFLSNFCRAKLDSW